MFKKVLAAGLGLLMITFLASVAWATIDPNKIMVHNVFEEDSLGYVLDQIALDTKVTFAIDQDIVERDITVDWSEGITLEKALDYLCGVDNVWGVENDVITVAPINPDNSNFQKLCGKPVEFTLQYVDSPKAAVELMDEYYRRFCKPDEERNRIIVHAPPKIREDIKKYLDTINSPREKVVLKSSVVFIRKSFLSSIGFDRGSYEWGGAVEAAERQLLEFTTGIGGVYESDKAGKLQLAINLLVQRGMAVRKANPSVVGEAGALIEAKFGEKTWQYAAPTQREEEGVYYYPEVTEIEAPVSLKAVPLVNGKLITLKDMEVISATLSRVEGFPVVSEQIARSRITLESGQTIIIGGLTQQTKKSLIQQMLPGKEWKEEEVEVLIFITPQIWTRELAKRETFLEKILEKPPVKEKKFREYLSIGACYFASSSLDKYIEGKGYSPIKGVITGQIKLNFTPSIGLFGGGGRRNSEDGQSSLAIQNIGLLFRTENELIYAAIGPGYVSYSLSLGSETYQLNAFMAQAELGIKLGVVKIFGGYRYIDKKWIDLGDNVNMSDYLAGIEIELK